MYALSACRVCLASDREMYPLANTALEETYERVTSGTLVVEGWPCCVCGVCLSALRRCRRFIDTALEANDALNLWMQNQPHTLKLVERPLWSFTQTPMACIEIGCQEDSQAGSSSWEYEVKLESDTTENIKGEIIYQPDKITSRDIGDVLTEKGKHAIVIENGRILGMGEIDSDDESHHLQMFDKVKTGSPQVLSNMECLDLYEGMINQQDDHLLSDNIKSDPALTKQTQIKSTHSSKDTDAAATHYDEENLFSCPQCNYKTQNTQMLNQNDIHTGRKPYTCDECGYTINQSVTLVHSKNLTKNQQISQNTGGKWFACNRCEFRCRHNFTLRQHLKTHTGEKPFACDKCNYKSNKQFSLNQHLRTHTGEKPFACDKCDSKFSLSSNLKRHLIIHSAEKFACNRCPSRFNRKTSLMHHLTKHADHSDKLNNAVKSKHSDKLNRAGKSKHTGVKRFACDECEYRCRHKFALKVHLRKHTGEKPFACDKCPFRCNQKPGLLRHLMLHTGEKPFACNQCNYKSNQHSGLKAHLMTHTGEKPFACDKCDLKFSLGCNLKRHLRTHTTEKLFVCLMCDAKLKSELTLKNHLRVHTGERPYVCDICGSNFTEKRSLKNHIVKVHGKQLVKPV